MATTHYGAYGLSNDPISKKEADAKFLTPAEGDAAYSAIDHDHDEDYAAIGHNHDEDYAAIQHDHASTKVGDETNYIEFGVAGQVTLAGSAKVVHDRRIPVGSALLSGATFGTYATAVGGAVLAANSDILYFPLQIPNGWDGDDLHLDVIWLPTTALEGEETVIFKVTYKACGNEVDITTGDPKTLTVTHTAVPVTGTPAGKVMKTRATFAVDDETQPLTAGDHIFVSVLRDATTDTFAGDVYVTGFAFSWCSTTLDAS